MVNVDAAAMSESDTQYWWVGVLCSLLACFGTVSGMMMQKWSHMKNEKLPPDQRRPPSRRPLWWMSLFLMIIVPSPLDVASLALAPQSLLAPLAAVTLLLNAILSPCFLGEILTTVDKIATTLIFIGAGLSTTFGEHKEHTYDVPGLMRLYSRPVFIIFQIITMALFAGLYVFIQRYSPLRAEWVRRHEGALVGYGQTPPFYVRALPFVYGLFAGLAGAQQFVYTKCASELISITIQGKGNQFKYGLTYMLAVLGAGFAVFQINYVSRGLALFDAVFYLPIYNAFLIVLQIVNGGVYFDEIAHVSVGNVLLFALGVSITLSGVLLLTQRQPRMERAETAEEEEDRHAGAALLGDDILAERAGSDPDLGMSEEDQHTAAKVKVDLQFRA